MACLDEVIQYLESIDKAHTVDLYTKERAAKKTVRFNTWAITPEIITDLFTGGKFTANEALEKVAKIVDNPKFMQKINGILKVDQNNPLTKGSGTDPILLRNRSIAFAHVMGSLKSEKDLTEKYGVSEETIKTLKSEGVFHVSTYGLLTAIGRDIAYDQGIKVTNVDAETTNSIYADIGMKAIEQLNDLVTLTKDGKVINRKYRNEQNKQISQAELIDGSFVTLNFSALGLNSDTDITSEFLNYIYRVPNSNLPGQKYDAVRDSVDTAKFMQRLKVPSNMVLPLGENLQGTVVNKPGTPTATDGHAKRLKTQSERPLQFDSHIGEILTEMSADVEANANPEIKKIRSNDAANAFVFGVLDSSDAAFDTQASVQGKSLSQSTPIQDAVNYAEDLVGNPLNYTFSIARTDRSFVNETVGNYQADKFFSRAVLTSGEYSFDIDDDPEIYVHLVNDVQDRSNLPIDVIMSEGVNPDIDKLVRLYNEVMVEGKGSKMKFITHLTKPFRGVTQGWPEGATPFVKSFKSVWQLMDALNGVNSIRQAKNGKITTTYMTEPDATASGSVITFTQLMGKNAAVDQVMADLGFTKDGEVALKDIYEILTKRVNELRTAEQTEMDDGTVPLEEYQKLLDMGIFGTINPDREASKPMTMTFVYNQTKRGAQKTIGNEIANKVLKDAPEADFAEIKAIVEDKVTGAKEAQTMGDLRNLEGVTKVLAEHYGQTVVGPLYDILNTEINTKLLEGNNKFLKKVYKAFQEAADKGNSRILVVPPLTYRDFVAEKGSKPTKAEYAVLLKKHGAPLMKVYETLTKDGILINQEFDNETNIFVNMQHMMDSAVQLTGYDIADELWSAKYGEELAPGAMNIHDANKSDARYNTLFQQAYKDAFVDLAEQYDFNEQLLNSLEAMPGSDANIVATLRKEIAGQEDAKIEALKNFDRTTSQLFGHDLEIETVPTPPKPKKTKPKAEPTKETKKPEPKEEPVTTKTVSFSEAVQQVIKTGKVDGQVVLDPFGDDFQVPELVRDFLSIPNVNEILALDEDYTYQPVADVLTVGKPSGFTDQSLMGMLHHEVTHFYTSTYILSGQTSNSTKYAKKAMGKLINLPMGELSIETMMRLDYIATRPDENVQLSEFIAIMAAEPEVANEIYEYVDATSKAKLGARLKDAIEKIMEAVRRFTIGQRQLDALEKNGINPKVLAGAISNIIKDGKKFREDQTALAAATAKISNTKAYKSLGAQASLRDTSPFFARTNTYTAQDELFEDPFSHATHMMNDYTRRMIEHNLIPITNGILSTHGKRFNEVLKTEFPMYARTTGYITRTWDDSTLVGQMMHYLTVDDFKDAGMKNKVLSIMLDAMQTRAKTDNTLVADIDALITDMSPEEKASLNTVYAKVPLFYLDAGEINRVVSGDIDAMIAEVSVNMSKEEITQAYDLASLYVLGITNHPEKGVRGSGLSTASNSNYSSTAANAANQWDIDKLTALEGLRLAFKRHNIKTLKDVTENRPELHAKLMDASLGLKNLNDFVYGQTKDEKAYRGNLAHDVFDVPKQFKQISIQDLRNNVFKEEDGWKLLREPKEGVYGIKYRDIKEQSFQEGAGTNVDYVRDDIMMPNTRDTYDLRENNAVSVPVGGQMKHKVVLTEEEKDTLGVLENVGKSLIRSYANLQMVADTQVIREEILKETYTRTIKYDSDFDALEQDIEDKTHPWMLKIPDNVLYENLSPEIKRKYKVVDSTLSGVKGFKSKVDLVRKDIAPWLEGYKEPVLFEHTPALRNAAHVIKQLVKLTKIHWIITNPVKIANDMASNTVLLLSKNISAVKVISYGKKAVKDLMELEKLRGEAVALRIQVNAGIPGSQAKLDRANAKIQASPVSFALYHGMIQSLSTDIVLKDYDTVSGLQRDMEKVLNKFLKTENDEDLNTLGKTIMGFAKWGIGADDVLSYLSGAAERTSATTPFASTLNEMAKNLKNIKNEDDAAKYVSQYIAGPDSEAARLGSAATQMADVIPRIILFQARIDEGRTEEQAAKEALESFIDYKVNMPKEIKALSDYGVLLFPSFWMRIQKVIWNLFKTSPASVVGAIGLNEMIGVNLPNIIDSNILSKWSNDQILNTLDLEILPEHILG